MILIFDMNLADRNAEEKIKCMFCGYFFPEKCGIYGCPNCNGEGLEDSEENTKTGERKHESTLKTVDIGLRN